MLVENVIDNYPHACPRQCTPPTPQKAPCIRLFDLNMKYPYLSLLDQLIRRERSNTVGRGLDEAHEVSWIKFSEVQRRSRYSNLLEETQDARVWVEDNLRRCKMGA